jgi:predicted nucleic acid-binding protein
MVVSSVEFYEIYRVIRRDISDERAIDAVSALRKAQIVPVDDSLALEAADLSLEYKLGMADAMIYATARRSGATLVTKDPDFEDLPDTVVIRA